MIKIEFKYISEIKDSLLVGLGFFFIIALLKLNSNRTWGYLKETVISLY